MALNQDFTPYIGDTKFMSKIDEIIDSLNDSNVDEVKKQLIAEAKSLNENNRRLYKRAKKAEGFDYDKDKKEWIKKEKKEEPKPPEKPNESDYATKLAIKTYLKSEGVTHPDDQKYVQDEAARLKMNVDEILIMDHVKTKLKNESDTREAQAGAPQGGGSGGGKSQGTVEYHLAKGTMPEDQDLAEKVLEAKMAKERKKDEGFGEQEY